MHMTWVEDATKNEDKQYLRRDVTECGKNMLDVCCDPTLYNEYIAVVETGNDCQLTDYMSSRGKNCHGGLLRGSVVTAMFLLVSLSTLPAEHETSNVSVVVWSGERSTLRITVRDTAQTERILMRVVDTSSLDSRLHQSSKRVLPRHPCFELVPSCCLCQCCTHNYFFFDFLNFFAKKLHCCQLWSTFSTFFNFFNFFNFSTYLTFKLFATFRVVRLT